MKKKSLTARHCICLLFLAGSVLLTRMTFLPQLAVAAGPPTFIVNSTADVVDANPGDGKCETAHGNGICTLRAAVMEANRATGSTILFGLPGAVTYKLSIAPVTGPNSQITGDLDISNTMTIVGNGVANTIIDANNIDRVFFVWPCIDNQYDQQTGACTIGLVAATISGVTIQNGRTSNFAPAGGGIFSQGALTLSNCVVSNNSVNTTGPSAWGGGIYALGALTLHHCTVSGNQATAQSQPPGTIVGGGIYSGQNVTMTNCTISGNMTNGKGGGIYGSSIMSGIITNSTISGNTGGSGGGIGGGGFTIVNSTISGNNAIHDGGGIFQDGVTELFNVTIARNTAGTGNSGTGSGGGIRTQIGTLNFQNTIISGNTAVAIVSGSPVPKPQDCSGTLTSDGYNIVSETSNCTINGSFSQANPKLGPLQNNGGPTQTIGLLSGSAAINGGNPNGCTDNLGTVLKADQRGYTRPAPASGRCDVGAFEAGGSLSHSLGNISTRAFVDTDNNVLIGGLIVSGGGPKKVILRALGPTLGEPPFNVPGALSNPVLELYDSAGNLIVSNDNWGSASNASAIQSSGYAPPSSLESAILSNLDPGNYTAILRGVNNTTGIALFEGYDLDSAAPSEFGNISTRAFVQTGANVMIAGIIIKGPDSQDVLIRALGPTLGQPPFNLPDSLQDPVLALRDTNGNAVATNDNWKNTQETEILASGYAPHNASESAIAITLAPGNYTAVLSGQNNTTGNALVEAYRLN